MYTTFGAPTGAFGGSNGAQSGTESRISTLITPRNSLEAISDLLCSLVIRTQRGRGRHRPAQPRPYPSPVPKGRRQSRSCHAPDACAPPCQGDPGALLPGLHPPVQRLRTVDRPTAAKAAAPQLVTSICQRNGRRAGISCGRGQRARRGWAAGLTAGRAGSSWSMATERRPGRRAAIELASAERGEHWWPVALAIIVVACLHVALPARYRVQPAWVIPVVLLALLALLIIGDPGRIDRQKAWLRVVTGILIGVIAVANLLAAVRLVVDILTSNKLYAHNPGGLLAAGGVIWATNVIAFGLWYWDLDRGGAASRAHHPDRNPAFVFPEMQHSSYVPANWVPRFVDYLSLAFWTATAISPTDISA